MRKRRIARLGCLCLLAASALPCTATWGKQSHAAAGAAEFVASRADGLQVGRLGGAGRLGRSVGSKLSRSWSTSTKTDSQPAQAQQPPGFPPRSGSPATKTGFGSFGSRVLWFLGMGTFGGILFLVAALVYGLLRLRPRRYRIR
ncbi:MAG: hypothetical protein ACTHK7_24140 [Aureliella sp.]